MPATAATLDLYREHKAEYVKRSTPVVIDVEPACYLTIEGEAEPGSDAYQQAIEALFAIAYTLKFSQKATGEADYKVCALEGFYEDRTHWRLAIRTPDFIATAKVKQTIAVCLEKGKTEACRRVELKRIKEGRCVQMLQTGPYSTICETMDTLLRFAAEQGLKQNGQLHEIYISDPRRVAPEKIKTLIRVPVTKA